ncbi:hypothetical protein Pelo_32 [Pelomyxa schiedti]|nr:hypothetical protein Pelo_32 [Pelomyxa schiedti]
MFSGSTTYAVAKCKFDAQTDAQLSIQQGETIEVLKKYPQGWTYGRNKDGKVGIFPSSYVEETTAAAIGPVKFRVRAIYDYTGSSPSELSFKTGDDLDIVADNLPGGWWRAVTQGKIGHIPSGFVQRLPDHLQPQGVDTKPTPPQTTQQPETPQTQPSPQVQPSSQAQPQAQPQAQADKLQPAAITSDSPSGSATPGVVQQYPYRARARYSYASVKDAELSFNRDDELTILNRGNNGWILGVLNNKYGYLPALYVEKIESGEPSSRPATEKRTPPTNSVNQTDTANPVSVSTDVPQSSGPSNSSLPSNQETQTPITQETRSPVTQETCVPVESALPSNQTSNELSPATPNTAITSTPQLPCATKATDNPTVLVQVDHSTNSSLAPIGSSSEKPSPTAPLDAQLHAEQTQFTAQAIAPVQQAADVQKIPQVPYKATALYDFKATKPHELGFSKGDEIIIVKPLQKGWLFGSRGDVGGIVPSKFVKFLEQLALPLKLESSPSSSLCTKTPEAATKLEKHPEFHKEQQFGIHGMPIEWFTSSAAVSFLCQLCKHVAVIPVFHSKSENAVFCRKCIDNWIERFKCCPLCSETVTHSEMLPLPPALMVEYLGLQVRCNNHGCTYTCPLSMRERHLAACQYQQTHCPSVQCWHTLPRRVLHNHVCTCSVLNRPPPSEGIVNCSTPTCPWMGHKEEMHNHIREYQPEHFDALGTVLATMMREHMELQNTVFVLQETVQSQKTVIDSLTSIVNKFPPSQL